MLKAVVHRHQRDFDQLRLTVHDPLQIAQLDPEILRLDDAKVEALLLQFQQVHERAVEMQRVGDDVSVEAFDREAVYDQVLARAGVWDVTDLGRLGVDQLREERLGIGSRGAGLPGAPARIAIRRSA